MGTSISSSNTFSVAPYTNKGMMGLVSGMDTESMVQQMLSGTQSKIDKQTGLKQQLTWKQEIYRNLITDINSFKTKYFTSDSASSLTNDTIFNAMISSSSSSAFSVTGTSAAGVGDMKVIVEQLATSTRMVSPSGGASGGLKMKLDFSNLDPDTETGSFQMALDGLTRTIELDYSKAGNESDFVADLQSKLDKAFGRDAVKLVSDGNGAYDFQVDSGRKMLVGGNSDVLSTMGLKNGQSNLIGTGTTLDNVSFKTKLQGEQFSFNINGVDFSFDKSANLYEVMKKVNNSEAGVRISYSSLTDSFTMESTTSGKGYDIDIEQTEGNLLTAMFGVESGKSVVSGMQVKNHVDGGSDEVTGFKEGVFSLSIDGKAFSVKFDKKDDGSDYTNSEILTKINDELLDKYGTSGADPAIKLEYSSTDGYQLKVNNGSYVTFGQLSDSASADSKKMDLAHQMGFRVTGSITSNKVDENTTMEEMGLTGLGGLSATDKVSDLEARSGGKYKFDAETGRITMTNTTGTTGSVVAGSPALTEKLFGMASVNLGDDGKGIGTAVKTAGQNSKVTVEKDGTTITTERNSNSFTLDGVNFSLKEVSQKDDAGNFISDTVTTVHDTDKVIDSVKAFVDDYNKLIETLNKYVGEKATYKNYAPLTSDQKKEMSDREVELWEEKAKEGLLRNDNDIRTMLSSMRLAMYQRPEGAKYALYDLGIETGNYEEQGELHIDEAQLRKMVEADPEAVRQLFTDTTNGISKLMSDAIDKAAKISSGSPGALVKKAGMPNMGLENTNDISKQMADITSKIKDLNAKYEKERQRYWNQFNQMEQLLANMNSQSSWIAQQFA